MSELQIYKGMVKKMKDDEIKEILEDWKIGIETGKDKYEIKVDGIGYTWKELNLLLDYITNLQQENERLKDELEWWKQQCDDLEMQAGVDYE